MEIQDVGSMRLELVMGGRYFFFQDILQVGRAAGVNELWFTPRMLSV
jgi:hypothetical protein